MATREDSAKIPIKLDPSGIREDLQKLKKSLETSMTEINQALEVTKKVYEVSAKAAGAVARELERGVKAALALEGKTSEFGRRLKDADDAVRKLHESIGQTVTRSKEWNELLSSGVEFVNVLTEFFRSESGVEWANSIATTLRGAARATIQSIQGAYLLGRDLGLFDSRVRDVTKQIGLAEAAQSALRTGAGSQVSLGPRDFGDRNLGLSGLYSATGRQTYAGLERREAEALAATLPVLQKQLEALKNADPFSDLLDRLTGSFSAGSRAPKSSVARGFKGSKEEKEIFRADYNPAEFRRQQFREEAAALDQIDDLKKQELEARAAWAEETERIESESLRAQIDANNEKISEAKRVKDELVASMGELSLGLISGGISAAAAAAGAGEDVLAAVKGFAGGMIQTVGQTLVQFGTAAMLAGLLGDAAPFLKPFVGVGEGVGLLAIAGGTALIAAGAALGGGGSSGAATTSYASGFAGTSTAVPASAYGITGAAPSGQITRITNVYLQGAVVANSPSEAGRTIKTWLKAADARGY